MSSGRIRASVPPSTKSDRSTAETGARAQQEGHEVRKLVRGCPVRPTGIGNASMNLPIFGSCLVASSIGVSIAPGTITLSVMPAPAQRSLGALRLTHLATASFVAG